MAKKRNIIIGSAIGVVMAAAVGGGIYYHQMPDTNKSDVEYVGMESVVNSVVNADSENVISKAEPSLNVEESSAISEESLVHYAWTVSPIKSTLTQYESSDEEVSDNDAVDKKEDEDVTTAQETEATPGEHEEESRGSVTADNEPGARPQNGSNQNSSLNQSSTQDSSTATMPSENQSSSSTAAAESSQSSTTSTPTNESSQATTSTPANESSRPDSNVPTTEASQNCNHAWASRLVTIHHDPVYEEQPVYGTKQGIIEDAWDEITGYRYGYITSDGTVFFIDDYGSISNCDAAVRRYAGSNGVSWGTYDQPIYFHHDAVYGDVPDYDNVVGYTKVEIIPAWDEQTYEYYCTKCGETLN